MFNLKKLPLGDLQGIMENGVVFKSLLVKESSESVEGQLFHEEECFTDVQKHRKVVIFPTGADVNAFCQDHVGSLFKFRDLVPGDDKLDCG